MFTTSASSFSQSNIVLGVALSVAKSKTLARRWRQPLVSEERHLIAFWSRNLTQLGFLGGELWRKTFPEIIQKKS